MEGEISLMSPSTRLNSIQSSALTIKEEDFAVIP
jgi:hypothetical protein